MSRTTVSPGRPGRWLLFAAWALLFLLHNDLWLWNDATAVLGLPVGLLYHLVFCLVAAVLMAALVRWAWPKLDDPGDDS